MSNEMSLQPAFFSAQIVGARRFYRDLRSVRSLPLAVVCGGCEYCTPDYHVQRSTFPYMGLEFVAQGRGRLIIGEKDYALASGTIFVYGPQIAQDITADPNAGLVKYFVDFTGKNAATLLAEAGIHPGQVFQSSAPSDLITVFDEMIRAGLRNTPFSSRITALLLELLIQKIGESRIPFGTFETAAFETYCRCRHVIEEQWRSLPTLEAVAEACHLNGAYLCRLFGRYDHISPYQYLLRMRMNFAAKQLQIPGATVKGVADILGFSDAFHFSRVFKKIIGISPSRFLGMERVLDKKSLLSGC